MHRPVMPRLSGCLLQQCCAAALGVGKHCGTSMKQQGLILTLGLVQAGLSDAEGCVHHD